MQREMGGAWKSCIAYEVGSGRGWKKSNTLKVTVLPVLHEIMS